RHERRIGITVFESIDVASVQEPSGRSDVDFLPLAVLFRENGNSMRRDDDDRQNGPRVHPRPRQKSPAPCGDWQKLGNGGRGEHDSMKSEGPHWNPNLRVISDLVFRV